MSKYRLVIIGFALFSALMSEWRWYDRQVSDGGIITVKILLVTFFIFFLAWVFFLFSLIGLLKYMASERRLVWKSLLILLFGMGCAVLPTWKWYDKDFAHSARPIRDTVVYFSVLTCLVSFNFFVVLAYLLYNRRKRIKE